MPSSSRAAGLHREILLHVEGQPYRAVLFRSARDELFSGVECRGILQSRDYHIALESAPPAAMDFWYVRIELGSRPVGVLSFQVKDYIPGERLTYQLKGSVVCRAKNAFISRIKVSVLCLGNLLITGDCGFCFQPGVSKAVQTLLMMEVINRMLTLDMFRHVGIVLVKDFYEDIFKELKTSPCCRKYHVIDTHPNMIMDIDPAWRGLEGYLSSLRSKYRVRANKALGTAREIVRTELEAGDIVRLEPKLHELYMKVVQDAGFNLFVLSPGYFNAMKQSLGKAFRIWAYIYKGEIIAFYTVFEDDDSLDAHFLGYDPAFNLSHKLYFNILLDMIGMAAKCGFKRLQLSRTATEIKSSAGATGVPMYTYIRHTRRYYNWLLPAIYRFFRPALSWEPRHPFKAKSEK